MERDTAGSPKGKPQGEVWNRHEMETDDTASGTDADAVRPTTDDEGAPGGLSGGGQPSGESHWDRVDDKPPR